MFRTGTARKWNPFFPPGSRGLLKLVGVEVNPMKTAFTMFKNAPIEELVIQGTDDRVTRFPYTPTSCTLLLEICSNPNLKTLCFDNIECISSNFIQGSGHARSLTRLVLREVRLMTEYWQGNQLPTVVLTEIETLELVWKDSDQTLMVLYYLSPPQQEVCFQNLKNLVITFPQRYPEARKQVWNVFE